MKSIYVRVKMSAYVPPPVSVLLQTIARVLFRSCTKMGFLFWELTGLSHCGVTQLNSHSPRHIASELWSKRLGHLNTFNDKFPWDMFFLIFRHSRRLNLWGQNRGGELGVGCNIFWKTKVIWSSPYVVKGAHMLTFSFPSTEWEGPFNAMLI